MTTDANTSIIAAEVHAAAGRLAGIAYRTPVLTCPDLDRRAGARVVVKCENLQRTGSFKFRGAYNALALLTAEQRSHGVTAALSPATQLIGVETCTGRGRPAGRAGVPAGTACGCCGLRWQRGPGPIRGAAAVMTSPGW